MKHTTFSVAELATLKNVHPLLQSILIDARREFEFRVLDTVRGKRAQMMAYRTGRSKAQFGSSPHNFVPALAVDLFPAPFDWRDKASFIALSKVIIQCANKRGTGLRWGGDWNRDGSIADGWDFPHFELHPWRQIAAKECRLAD